MRTRERILAAASDLFVADGYAGASMTAIAGAAGVSVQTIYLAVGPKADVLRAAAAQAVLGSDRTGAVPDLEWVGRLIEEQDPHVQLRLLVGELVALAERAAPLWRVMAQAAVDDPELATDVREHEAGRLSDQRALVGMLHGLRMPTDRAADIVNGFLRPEIWNVFVVERGWAGSEVEELVFDVLSHLLL